MPRKATFTRYTCEKCGITTCVTPQEHFKQVHQTKCTIRFSGEQETIPCERGPDRSWRCPRCPATFAGSCRKIQDHARHDHCSEVLRPRKRARYQVQAVDSSDEETESSDDDDASGAINDGGQSGEELADVKKDEEDDGGLLNDDSVKVKFTKAESAQAVILGKSVAEAERAQKTNDTEKDASAISLVSSRHKKPVRPAEATAPANAPSTSQKQATARFTAFRKVSGREAPGILAVNEPPRPSGWARLLSSSAMHRVTPLDALQADRKSRNASSSTSVTRQPPRQHQAPIGKPVAPAADVLVAQSHSPAVPLSDSSTPSTRSSVAEASSSHLVMPAALKAFFDTLRVPCEHLGHIFIDNGFDTDVTLNFLCELPVDGHWEDMKKQIVETGRLAGWLAIQKGLEQRAQSIRANAR